MRRKILTIVGLVYYGLFVQAQILVQGKVTGADDGLPLPQVTVLLKGTTIATPTDADGNYKLNVPSEKSVLVFRYLGYVTTEVTVGTLRIINVQLGPASTDIGEVVVTALGIERSKQSLGYAVSSTSRSGKRRAAKGKKKINQESYATIDESGFKRLDLKPLSTFSVDVDVAAYANVRRLLNQGTLPPKDAVRIEEMLNYFSYDYAQPTTEHPFAIHSEYAECPWEPKHKLLKIGVNAKTQDPDESIKHNLVFLIDVSGSMSDYNKLPLVQQSLRMLVNKLRPEDKISIVVYAGAAGTVLEPTAVRRKAEVLDAIDNLKAGGSTAGGQGLELAYALAEKQFKKNGNNRIILATDGDFNVGLSSDSEMTSLIESKRDMGIYLTCLGFGMGNYKDAKLELLADKGNGNYAYIDNIREAKKVLVDEMNGTLITMAKDVKLQVEFNPDLVAGYRLIGYENRRLEDEDFKNDARDAGDMGAGHQVTALYEIIPAGIESDFLDQVAKLRYRKLKKLENQFDAELATVKVRYKQPKGRKSILVSHAVGVASQGFDDCSADLRFASAVAMFGMLLRDSEYKGNSSFQTVEELAQASRGTDTNGYRAELVSLIQTAALLWQNN
ncbi:MAG: VWA domain-containing protein [Roseivirga sp.]